MLRQTIYALSTPAGKSAVAVVRISGPKTLDVIGSLCPSLASSRLARLTPRRAILSLVKHPRDHQTIDKALVLYFEAPKSFTGEDVAELHLHGGRAVVQAVLNALPLCCPSLRYAEPGEFSKRAFINGKMDLTQAEGLAELINAETEEQRKAAFRQADGALKLLYDSWRTTLIGCRSSLEAIIDFGEDEEIDETIYTTVIQKVVALRAQINNHLTSSLRGELLRGGIKVAIFGPPNAGKSSLLNNLAQRKVAIVSAEAGTTRDVVETILDIGGFPVIVGDTAGLREGEQVGEVEREGIRRTKMKVREANLNICLIEKGSQIDHITREQLNSCGSPVLLLLNKSDLEQGATNTSDRHGSSEAHAEGLVSKSNIFSISCKTGEGMHNVLDKMISIFRELTNDGGIADGQASLGTNARHREQIRRCLMHLDSYMDLDQKDVVMSAEELRYACDALGRVIGRVDVEEILGRIFSDFCIGK